MKKGLILILVIVLIGAGAFILVGKAPSTQNTFLQHRMTRSGKRAVQLSSSEKALVSSYLSKYVTQYPLNKDQDFINSGSDQLTALSEAQGYGMMIAVLAQLQGIPTKNTFKKLDAYVKSNQDGQTGLMSWKQTLTKYSIKRASNSATDGDLWIAESLLIASHVYQNKGYLDQANSLLVSILTYDYNANTNALTLGNWATNGGNFNDVRTSDVIPAFFKDFYHATGDKRWKLVDKSMSRALLKSQEGNATGLVPDFIYWDGERTTSLQPDFLSDQTANQFGYSALRIPLNISLIDDTTLRPVRFKMISFFNKQKTLAAGYDTSGFVVNNWPTEALNGPLYALSNRNSKISTPALRQATKATIINSGVTGKHYYEETLGILSLLLAQ